MAITQISRITHRKGLNENLPQLAGAELGWALDQRKLYIGNGTVSEGAPTVGNTEILTEYSDILEVARSYTYKGADAGYTVQTGVDSNNPVTRTLQQKLDENASVKDFGAVGDGVTDDTDAINRAMEQLFTREQNVGVRRGLFFPAGTYKVTDTIKIPAFAKLYGEGAQSSRIKYYSDGSVADQVIRTSDSKNQVSPNITNNGALVPTDIEISSMGFETTENNDIFLIESTVDSTFEDVAFVGPLTTGTISAASNKACVRLESTVVLKNHNLNFNNCTTEGTGFGFYTEYDCRSVTVSNSHITTHYKGIVLGDSTLPSGHVGPQGFRIQHCLFDDIHSQGVEINNVTLNVSAFNIFYDVGNQFGGAGNPTSTIVDIGKEENISIGDLFERDDTDATSYQRVFLKEQASIGFDCAHSLMLGTLKQDIGKVVTLNNNVSSATTIFTVDLNETHTNSDIGSFKVKYSIKRGDGRRTGVLTITSDGGTNTLTYDDEYTENSSIGVVFSVTQSSDDIDIKYTTTNDVAATLSYSLERLY